MMSERQRKATMEGLIDYNSVTQAVSPRVLCKAGNICVKATRSINSYRSNIQELLTNNDLFFIYWHGFCGRKRAKASAFCRSPIVSEGHGYGIKRSGRDPIFHDRLFSFMAQIMKNKGNNFACRKYNEFQIASIKEVQAYRTQSVVGGCL